ncbi:non-specific lipid-transfer protein C4 [Lolium perenne]|uniref:non-specific lipid-transfer protein C4 n=1 Tax=Lolium perenne TaxID=4522 RepID=UPI0021F55D70|nr:non-specific lipid-transfer protein C4-like [Lolium perenne]
MAPSTVLPRALLAACVVVLLLLASTAPAAEAQGECVPQLNRLLACRAYLVPGAADPSPECCSALGSISRDCACSTMGIINSLPSRCNIGQVNCAA